LNVRRGIVICAALAVLAVLAKQPERRPKEIAEAALLPRADVMKLLLAGNYSLGADFFFVQMLVVSTLAFTPDEYKLIYPYALLVSDLDPKFVQLYRVAGTLLPANLGNDRWVNTVEADHVLARGLEHFPDDLQLGFLDAFTSAFYLRKYHLGGEKFVRLSKKPGAQPYFGLLGVRLLAEAGDTQKAFRTSLELAELAPDEQLRELLRERSLEVSLEQVLQTIDKGSMRFSKLFGRWPVSLEELVDKGLLQEGLSDPLGGRLFIDSEGVSHSSSKWFRLRFIENRRKKKNEDVLGPQKDFRPLVK
jgi:hypothetical protein